MSKYVDRVMDTSTTTGTGDFTLSGTPVTGYQSWNAAIGTGIYSDYAIVAVDGSGNPTGQWEVGQGYLSAATTLVRDRPSAGSASTPVNFSAGTKRVFLTHSAAETMDKGNIFAAGAGMNWL